MRQSTTIARRDWGVVWRGALLLLAVLGAVCHAADRQRLEHTIQGLSTHGSRLSGYPGDSYAADQLELALRQAGVADVTREEFEVVVPVDEGGRLELLDDGTSIELIGLWPNLVRTNTTPPEGIVGPLFYGRQGEYTDLDGQQLDGAIVLLEFNSWNNWLKAAALGARAIIFIAPEQTTIFEARQKWNWAPHDVPRFWLDRDQGLA